MAATAGDLDLPEETLGAERMVDFGTKQLERRPALVSDIVRKVEFAHPACRMSCARYTVATAPQLSLVPVAISQTALKLLR
jgi:hypothetical protein